MKHQMIAYLIVGLVAAALGALVWLATGSMVAVVCGAVLVGVILGTPF